jgi:hypothetical protein
MGNRKIELENREKVWVGLQKLAFERVGIPFIRFIPVSQKMKKKEQPGRSFPSSPPETSKVFTTGLQPQTNFNKALPVPTLGSHHLLHQSAILVQRSPAIPLCS